MLGDYARREQHGVAARSSLEALCDSLNAFLLHVAPRLHNFGTPDPHAQVASTTWLDVTARRLNRILESSEDERLVWPPPGQKTPAIVTDLTAMYAIAAESTIQLRSDDETPLSDVLQPIADKACAIAKAWPVNAQGLARRVTRPTRMDRDRKLSLAQRLAGGAGVLAVGVSLLQAPGAIHDVWPDTVELAADASSIISAGMHAALDAATTMRRDLGIDPLGYIPPWVERGRRRIEPPDNSVGCELP